MTSAAATPRVDIGTFAAESVLGDDGTITVVCSGEADPAALVPLGELVHALHALALEHKVKEVILDVRKVSFMNSSSFTKLVGWITRVRALDAADRYGIRLRSDSTLLWQRKSLGALRGFATELVTIEDIRG